MTSISSNPIALASYTAASKATATAGTGNTASNTTNQQSSEKPADPVAEIKRLAQMMQARQTGGLFAAMAKGSSQSSSLGGLTGSTTSSGNTATIPLPDVGELEKEDAQKLLTQVQKLIDNGVTDGISFKGSNGDKQTDSLSTYRDWLQAKVGIDIYA